MTTSLPSKANLSHLRKQAKDLLNQAKRRDKSAIQRFLATHPGGHHLFEHPASPSLHDAQWVIALELGFGSWPKLHAHLTSLEWAEASSPLPRALHDLRQGKMVILFDDEGRENEGDFIMAAEKVTPEAVNFMTKHARGTLCLALADHLVEKLQLPLMAPSRALATDPAFTLSIDASTGISTGVSARDRATTIAAAIAENADPASVKSPGHIFPLRAEKGGLRDRIGHTEGSVDLVKLAGMKPAAVICEILNDDGTMARWKDLEMVSERFNIPLIRISSILDHQGLPDGLTPGG